MGRGPKVPKGQKEGTGVELTFQLTGPILRQIIDDGPRPPRAVAIENISLWVTATQLHIFRFRRSLKREIRLFNTFGPTRRYACQRVRVDEHMLLASAANLEKAIRMFSAEVPELELPGALPELLRHLRNVYEHWEDYMPHVAKVPATKGSGKKLKELHPTTHLWSIEIDPGRDIKIARVLSLGDLQKHLRKLARQLRKLPC